MTMSTTPATAASVSSTRRSPAWQRRRPWSSVNRDPAGVHDFADRLVALLGDPGEEPGARAVRNALGHHPEVTHAAVLAGLGVAQRARDALEANRVHTAGVRERDEADGLFVAGHGVLLEAVG